MSTLKSSLRGRAMEEVSFFWFILKLLVYGIAEVSVKEVEWDFDFCYRRSNRTGLGATILFVNW